MGSEDNANSMDNLYLITEDGYKVPMTATMFCIPNLIDTDVDENSKSDSYSLDGSGCE